MANLKSRIAGRGVYVFGVECMGRWAINNPILATSLVIILTLMSAVSLTLHLRFDSDISRVLANRTDAYELFVKLESEFHPFSYDEVVLVRSSNLQTASGLEKIRGLHLDLQLIDQMDIVISVFSLVRKDKNTDNWQSALSGVFTDDKIVVQSLKRLLEDYPAARSMIAPDNDLLLFLLMPKVADADAEPGFSPAALKEIDEIFDQYETDAIHAQLVGKPTIERELVDALKWDQIVLSSLAIIVCSIVTLVVFRTLAAAIVCTLPTVLALVWYLGFISAIGASIDILTTVIPALIIVLAFADTLHLFFHWRRFCDRGQESVDAIKMAVTSIGPACALAGLTTGIAFSALTVASNEALNAMAFAGMAGVLIVFLTVLFVTPLAMFWSLKLDARYKPAGGNMFEWASRAGQKFLDQFPRSTIIASICLAVLLSIAHYNMEIQFRFLDYAPRNSHVIAASEEIDEYFGGAGQMFALIPREQPDDRISVAERLKLEQIEAILQDIFGDRNLFSLASLAVSTGVDTDDLDLSKVPKGAEPFLRRFISEKRDQLLVTVFVSHNVESKDILALIDEAQKRISILDPQIAVELTGGPVIRATAVPELIFDLRHGLLLSVILSVTVIGFAVRSWRLGLACLLPNIIPILAVEAVVWPLRGGIDMTTTIALMIGFGLAVNDSVHLLNHYLIEKQKSSSNRIAMRGALRACSPALVVTTIVLGIGLSVAVFSSLPTVILYAFTVISILIFALLSDIFLLPSVAVWMDEWFEDKSR